MNGIALTVARTAGADCTNGGITSRRDRLTLVGTLANGNKRVTPLPRRAQLWAATDDAPAVAIRLNGNTVHIVPVVLVDPEEGTYAVSDVWHMAGGNYAVSLDSRVGDVIESLLGHRFYGAMSVHDRVETM